MPKRVAIVLFNLGGPDGPDAVQPFLFNLFNDKAIIRAPALIRWGIAKLISTTRAPSARENYAKMGGGSPLLPETQKQADALEQAVAKTYGFEAKCFIAMRYWRPFTEDAVRAVKNWGADETVLLPLYPQFSTTTTGSSLDAWRDAGGGEARAICCYPTERNLIEAHAEALLSTWRLAGEPDNMRVLLSAHGLPERVVKDGDPYQWQVEQSVDAVAQALPGDWDVEVCYQSRVGPLTWIGPSTEDAIERAAQDGKKILLSPIAFVSEHIETLVELDEEYKEYAEDKGVETYLRAPALGVAEAFISGLADLVGQAIANAPGLQSHAGGRICPKDWGACRNVSAFVDIEAMEPAE